GGEREVFIREHYEPGYLAGVLRFDRLGKLLLGHLAFALRVIDPALVAVDDPDDFEVRAHHVDIGYGPGLVGVLVGNLAGEVDGLAQAVKLALDLDDGRFLLGQAVGAAVGLDRLFDERLHVRRVVGTAGGGKR